MGNQTNVQVQGGHGKIRKGRGFSQKELAAAGITLSDLKAKGLLFDARRRSSHDSNVEQLKEHFAG